jgi:phosphate transport system protein
MDTNVEPTMTVLRGAVAPPSRGALDRDERLVKDGILRMGSLVESQIRDAIRAVVERDADLAEHVIEADARVNEMQREIADTVLMTIATQSPVARDLRFLMALDHVAFELERIGDHASGIAKVARRLFEEPALREIRDLARIGGLAAEQVRGVVSALIDIDDVLARQVAARDDEIDHSYRAIFGEIIDLMRADPDSVESGTRVILAAHWVERIGDRVTNIAEDVVYLATGQVEDLNP